MKKLLTIMVLGLTILMGFSSPIRAEVYPYTFQFYDNYQYDLTTGQFRANPYWVATSREIIPTTNFIMTDIDLASYVLFFTETNYFIGYYTINGNGTIHTNKYMNVNVTTPEFTPPASAKKIAFTSMKVTTGQLTDLPNTPSYADVFDNPTFLDYEDNVLNDTLGNIFGNPSYLNYVWPTGAVTLEWMESGYLTSFNNYVYDLGVPILELKNLIQNGQFNSASYWSTMGQSYISNGQARIYTSDGSYSGISTGIILTVGQNYYFAMTLDWVSGGYIAVTDTFTGISWNNDGFKSFTAISNYKLLVIKRSFNPVDSYIDDVILFHNPNSYTKTQIDSAIAFYGYFPYNVTINAPDVTVQEWIDYDLEEILLNASSYSGNITEINSTAQTFHWENMENDMGVNVTLADRIYLWQLFEDASNEIERWEWYEYGGVASYNYTYYQNLYQSAVNQTPRWEFFRDFGVTSTNYEELYAEYEFLNQETAIPFGAFSYLDGLGDREESTYERLTLAELIEEILGEWNLGDYVFIIVSILSMLIMVIVLGMKKSPFSIIYIMCGILFLMFAVFGWFPTWLVLLISIILFIISLKIFVN